MVWPWVWELELGALPPLVVAAAVAGLVVGLPAWQPWVPPLESEAVEVDPVAAG